MELITCLVINYFINVVIASLNTSVDKATALLAVVATKTLLDRCIAPVKGARGMKLQPTSNTDVRNM